MMVVLFAADAVRPGLGLPTAARVAAPAAAPRSSDVPVAAERSVAGDNVAQQPPAPVGQPFGAPAPAAPAGQTTGDAASGGTVGQIAEPALAPGAGAAGASGQAGGAAPSSSPNQAVADASPPSAPAVPPSGAGQSNALAGRAARAPTTSPTSDALAVAPSSTDSAAKATVPQRNTSGRVPPASEASGAGRAEGFLSAGRLAAFIAGLLAVACLGISLVVRRHA
jgi:hypothetical protein